VDDVMFMGGAVVLVPELVARDARLYREWRSVAPLHRRAMAPW